MPRTATEPKPAAPTPAAKPKSAAKKPAPKKRAAPKARKRATREMKLPVSAMLTATAGLREKETELVAHVLGILQAAGKKPRQRIIAALAKIFA